MAKAAPAELFWIKNVMSSCLLTDRRWPSGNAATPTQQSPDREPEPLLVRIRLGRHELEGERLTARSEQIPDQRRLAAEVCCHLPRLAGPAQCYGASSRVVSHDVDPAGVHKRGAFAS